MKNISSRSIERAINLVEEIQEKLILLETKTGHSAEMAQVRSARRELTRLHRLLRSCESGRSKVNWKLLLPLIGELAYILVKHTTN